MALSFAQAVGFRSGPWSWAPDLNRRDDVRSRRKEHLDWAGGRNSVRSRNVLRGNPCGRFGSRTRSASCIASKRVREPCNITNRRPFRELSCKSDLPAKQPLTSSVYIKNAKCGSTKSKMGSPLWHRSRCCWTGPVTSSLEKRHVSFVKDSRQNVHGRYEQLDSLDPIRRGKAMFCSSHLGASGFRSFGELPWQKFVDFF